MLNNRYFHSNLPDKELALFFPFGNLNADQKLIVKNLAITFEKLINDCPDLTHTELLKRSKKQDSETKARINTFLERVRMESEFPRRDPVFQATIWLFRSAPKKDYHCHLGMGWDADTITEIIRDSNIAEFRSILNRLGEMSFKGWRKTVTKIYLKLPYKLIKKRVFLKFIIRLSGVLRHWDTISFFIINKSKLKIAVMETARNYLRDGVTQFSMRLNPFKFEAENEAIKEKFQEILNSVIEGLDETADEFSVPRESLNITICLNRLNDSKNLRLMKATAPQLNTLPTSLSKRIRGFDLSGPECFFGESGSLQKWKEILKQLPDYVEFSPHVGDIRNISKSCKKYNLWIGFLESRAKYGSNNKRTIALLLEYVEKHLEFIEAYVNIMPINSSFAHGITLGQKSITFFIPKKISNPFGAKEIYCFNLEGHMPAELVRLQRRVLDQINGIKTVMRGKNIKIYFCPTTTVKSLDIKSFRTLPVFQWLYEDKFIVKIGVDGTYQYPQPVTISEELAKIYLTEPVIGSALRYQDVLNLAN